MNDLSLDSRAYQRNRGVTWSGGGEFSGIACLNLGKSQLAGFLSWKKAGAENIGGRI